jgi:hypothetical protein
VSYRLFCSGAFHRVPSCTFVTVGCMLIINVGIWLFPQTEGVCWGVCRPTFVGLP